MRIAGFGTYDTRHHPRVAVLLQGLAEHGHEVREINAPWSFDTAARVKSLGSPLPLLTAFPKLLAAWFRLVRLSRQGPRPDVVLVGHLGHLDVLLAKLLFPRARIVLDLLIFLGDTARDRGAQAGRVTQVLDRLDRLAVAVADVVVVDTEEHRALMPAAHRGKAVVVPVGAPEAWFAARRAPEEHPEGPLQVVFFGLYTPLQGAPVIAEALELAGTEAAITATMIGSGQDLEAAKAAAPGAHIRWIDRVDSVALPAVVADHDVCLGIVGTSAKGLRVVPNKVFQGAAAGCVVVTSDTAPQRRALGHDAVLVPPGDARALADALVALAADRDRLAAVRAACTARADRDFRPAAVVRPLLEVLISTRAAPAPLAPNARLRWSVVGKRVARLSPSTVLEIGCGGGAFGARIAGRAGVDYLGVEPDPTSCEVARTRIEPRGGVVRNEASSDLPEGSTFDLVCAFEVLEHLEDDVAALTEWTTHVKPGGHLMLSVPAFQARFNPWDTMVGHYRRYEPAGLKALLEQAGYVDVDVVVYGWPLGLATENVRARIAGRRLAKGAVAGASQEGMSQAATDDDAADSAFAERTASSARQLQPSDVLGPAVTVAVSPFAALQRLRPQAGTGLVAVGRRPSPTPR